MKGNNAAIHLTIYNDVLSSQIQNQVIEFWLQHGVLNQRAARERVSDVLIIARNTENKIIGIFTYALKYIPLLRNYMYLIRLSISPGNSSAFLVLKMGKMAYEVLKEKAKTEQKKPLGLFALIQNNKMIRKWNWAIWPRLPFIYIGSTNSGHHRRVLYFK
ncbi:MAG: hypothetical protein RLO81_10540 [Fulvivirga sp.]|uniref:hypothetical protein n=1 Tax=Fulvivirga sp. TaxID=1931237 RepID=UPI0032EF7EF8